MITLLPWLLAAALAIMGTLWLIQLRTKDAGTADVGWAFLMVGGIVIAALVSDGDPARRILVGGIGTAWALRLGIFLLRDRVIHATAEDGRYRALRDHWGDDAGRNFVVVYLGQIGAAALFVTPIAAAMSGGALGWVAAFGAAIGVAAFAGEAVADRQLARFRSDPSNRGQVCQVGLWRYSRHPNYFFEWCHWWAYVVIAEGALLTLLGPAAMLLFLFRLTGIPYTEKQALKSRGEAYRRYQKTTSVFIPRRPKTVPS